MFRLKQIKLNKIKKFFGKLPRILGEYQFISSLVFIFIALVLGSLIFYQYSFLIEKKEPKVLEKGLYFNEKTFQEILKVWQDRQKKFEEVGLKTFSDPFRLTK